MAAVCLLAWALFAHDKLDLAQPWSGWFVALFVCALIDLLKRGEAA